MMWENEEDIVKLESLMLDFKDKVLEKLSQLEIAALFEDLKDFVHYYKEDLEEKSVQHRLPL